MATNFPTGLDALTNPISTDTLNSPSHSGQHTDANDAIEALQAKVGVNSSAVTTSLDYKVGQLETNSVSKTVVDAKGDLLVGTGVDAVDNLAVGGTNNHVLVVDSGDATFGVKWQGQQEVIVIPISDETTTITTGTAKVTFRMPFAMTLTAVRASLTTASTSGLPTFDINEGGSTILSTKITIDANELTSTTAATQPVISDSALADDASMTIDIDVAGTGAKGAKIYLIGRRT